MSVEVEKSSKVILPTSRIPPSRKSPGVLVIYSKPKAGKTSLIAQLDNCLLLDFEKGSDFVDAMKVTINDLADLKTYGEEIKKAGRPYKYIAVDTITALEDMVMPLAIKKYKETPMGKNFDGESVLKLPNGAGYLYLREAFFDVVDYIKSLSHNVIFLGHLKDKSIEIKGKEVMAADIDLTGKLKSLLCSTADAIGFLSRDGDNTILNFNSSDLITCGSRPEHLRNQELVVATMKNNKLETYWDKIYID
jgi:hypothetical protein